MPDREWSNAEKKIARRVFDTARQAVLAGTMAEFKAKGLKTVEFLFPEGTIANLEKAHAETVAAMRDGADIIYQGTFFDGRWRCHPDFLNRVDRPSKLGDYSYEVADAKLARKAKVDGFAFKTI